jgi:hypothetical protein
MLKINNQEPKIATCNIECWVVFVDEKLDTPWPDVKKVSSICDGKYAYLGIYSYKHKQEAELFESILKREAKIEIRGAIIPEGSKYYVDVDGETIVANRMWIKEKYKGD